VRLAELNVSDRETFLLGDRCVLQLERLKRQHLGQAQMFRHQVGGEFHIPADAMACHAKSGLAQSMARELMPQGIHVANVPIDAAIGWTQEDGTRAHRLAGTTVDDNMADPVHIAETYLQLHRQHRSTWAFQVVQRPWVEKW